MWIEIEREVCHNTERIKGKGETIFMKAEKLETQRLILRPFAEDDMVALFTLLRDEEVNRFLPWFPVRNVEETKAFYQERFALVYQQDEGYAYAICLKEENVPIGYVDIDAGEGHELGYALRKEYHDQGIVTEAVRAVLKQAETEGFRFVMATHDRENPASGRVMQKAGMKYCYSYRENWQPKNMDVVFRMYQLNFDKNDTFVYTKLWDARPDHFIETDM